MVLPQDSLLMKTALKFRWVLTNERKIN